MVYIFLGLISMLVLFLWSTCKLSSNCAKTEENFDMKER